MTCLPNQDVDNDCQILRESREATKVGNMMVMGGFSCSHVDYVMLQLEICPGTNFIDAKTPCFLGLACMGTLWVATLDKVLASKN